VRRSSYVPPEITGGIYVTATDPELLGTLDGTTASGHFIDRATERYPAIVLGAKAAQRLGLPRVDGLDQVYVSGRLFTVVGILEPLPLVPELDSAALIGSCKSRATSARSLPESDTSLSNYFFAA